MMTTSKNPDPRTDNHNGFAEHVAEAILGPNPFVGFSPLDIFQIIRKLAEQALKQPMVLVEQQAVFVRELIRILVGQSDLAPEQGDRRFQDPAWRNNPFYRSWLQGYLAWSQGLKRLVSKVGLDSTNTSRAHFVTSLLTEALAPTNFLPGNPEALKKALETGGESLICGLSNLLGDIATNGGMPSQVDKSAFQVGKNLALSPGAVVFKTEVFELIQYAPASDEVYLRPLLVVPPQINKFYLLDLAPGKSFIEYAVKNGLQVFVISWRNPTAAHRDWSLETYLYSLLEAIDAVRAITGSEEVNTLGACAGGITLTALLAHLAAKGDTRINSTTSMVTLLDTQAESQLGLFATKETIALAKRASQLKGVLGGDEMGRIFTWLRPNDLFWNYWVNNYLMGNDPPAFDVLYWSNDSTRLPARLHGDILDIFLINPFKNPGSFSVFGTPVNLSKVECDTYIIAGITDHITPWKGCYSTTQMLGGKREFILSSSGHIQSIINPPGNPKARFFTNPQFPENPDDWLAGAQQQSGSWWEHWRDWIVARSGESRRAPSSLGNQRYSPATAAPGTYVFET
jgi:poly[(R)-3-hydroxyalkanoate] polymerase subunit PhaC